MPSDDHKEEVGRPTGSFRKANPKDRNELDPYEINFLPEFRKDRGPEEAFVNEYGVVIGDYMYESPESPLQQWDKDTDPAIMSGDQWVHPYKDIGFQTTENRDYFEKRIPYQGGIFMHQDQDVARELDTDQRTEAQRDEMKNSKGKRPE